MQHVDVFVTNAGFGGVQLALAHGVPILAAGRSEDKAEVAARIAYAGVGIDLRTQRPSTAQLRTGVRQLLAERRYSETADRVPERDCGIGACRKGRRAARKPGRAPRPAAKRRSANGHP